MKNLKRIFASAMFLFGIATILTSCNKDNMNPFPGQGGNEKSITAIAASNPDLSTLVAALKIAKLDVVLDKPGVYTVFAPNNAAFGKFLEANKIAKLEDVPVELLTKVLLNHVVARKFTARRLPADGYLSTLSPVKDGNTLSLYVKAMDGKVKLNGKVGVTKTDINASNGVIHLVDSVIGLETVVGQALANASFTSLVGALTSKGQPDFPTILSAAGPFTVFAPTNDAFTALDKLLSENGGKGIAGVSSENLTTVLQYHVVSGNILAASLKDNQVVSTLATQDFTINLPKDGPTITDVAKRVTKIVATDVQCTNGVIHVVSGVLLPKLK